MRIGLVQFDIVWESKKDNYGHAERFVQMASRNGCDIVVFPEMFNTGFSMNIPAVTEDQDGETALILSRMAAKNDINIIAGYAVNSSEKGRGRNQAVVFNREGKCTATFVKLHSFSFAKEDQFFCAGDKIVSFDLEGMASSVFICFDLRFPEVFRRIAKHVQAIFVLANWPSTRVEHWEILLRARAIENQCFVIGVNRTGTDGNGINYPGRSKIFGPTGNEICSGGEGEELLISEVSPQEAIEVREKFPFLTQMSNIYIN